MKKKIITALAIVAGLVLAFWLRIYTTYVFDFIIVAAASIAAIEMSRLISKAGRYNNIYVALSYPPLMYVGLILLFTFGHPMYEIVIYMVGSALLFAVVAFLWSFFFKRQTREEMKVRNQTGSLTKFSLKKALNSLLAIIYPTLFFFFFIFINHIDMLPETVEKTAMFGELVLSTIVLIFAYIVPIATDTFAWLVGSTIQGPKLCPKISPNKRVSGAIGGLLFAIVFSLIYFLVLSAIPEIYASFAEAEIYMWHFIVIGGVSSLVSIGGDIFESLLKRIANVKDSGTILPGHGGALDRIDSYIFTVAIMFLSFMLILI